ncbi:hypothetical protein [Natronoglycomyces albus]|uniref:Acetone carboxylase n=1 Tax=Natronoglycomyces albus TaxID=2811108 RepID=A0A895XVT1_9ACTN|nr:hypothetical protein [Natronoglycomyces albus]QSB06636.1 hypothetical protein JQS30_07005 [Natronoglycomyces albus]
MSTETVFDLVCSARGCRNEALWALQWRNPRIHSVDRLKTWTACDKHREQLRSFLVSRGFPVEVANL